jgi:hypothetical protein
VKEDFDLDDIRFPDDLAEKYTNVRAGKRQDRYKFHKFPFGLLESIAAVGKNPTLVVCCALLKLYFDGFGENPVTLTSRCLESLRVSRGQKLRALKILESTEFFTVKREIGKNPLVTLNWLPMKSRNGE